MKKLILSCILAVASVTMFAVEQVSKVYITVNFPADGEYLTTSSIVIEDTKPYQVVGSTLFSAASMENVSSQPVTANTSYRLEIDLEMDEDGYVFTDNVQIHVNGELVNTNEYKLVSESYLSFYVPFSVNAGDNISIVNVPIQLPEAGEFWNADRIGWEIGERWQSVQDWLYNEAMTEPVTGALAPSTTYVLDLSIEAIDPYTFADDVIITVNCSPITEKVTAYCNENYQRFHFEFTTSASTTLENISADVRAVKIVRDGQLLIEREGQVYNAQGTELR